MVHECTDRHTGGSFAVKVVQKAKVANVSHYISFFSIVHRPFHSSVYRYHRWLCFVTVLFMVTEVSKFIMLCVSHTNRTCTHEHTHTRTFAYSRRTYTLSPLLTYSLPHAHTHTHTLSLSLSLSLVYMHTHTQDMHRLKLEMAILREVKHPNIIRLRDIFETRDTFYIVTEKCVFIGQFLPFVLSFFFYFLSLLRRTKFVFNYPFILHLQSDGWRAL